MFDEIRFGNWRKVTHQVLTQAKACSRCKAVAYCSQVRNIKILLMIKIPLTHICCYVSSYTNYLIHFQVSTQACQKKDWSRHRSNCHPIVVAELKGRGRGLVASREVFILLSLFQVWPHFPALPTILHLLRRSAPFDILTCSGPKNWFSQGFHLFSFQTNEYYWKHPFAQIKKGELVLAELPAIVVQDGGDLAASESVPLFVFAKIFFLSLSPCSDSFFVFFMLLTWNC